MKRGLIVTLVAALQIACSNPRELAVTESNRQEVMEKVAKSSMPDADKQMFVAAMAREQISGVAKAFGGTPLSLNGKTVGQVIDEQAKFVKDAEAAAAREKALAAEAKAKEEALVAELRKAISLTVFDKGFIDKDVMAGRFNAFITIKCVYENTSGKDIRAFTGDVRFTDLFDKPVFESGLTISDPLKAGAKANWLGSIEHNPFMADREALKNAKLADLKIVWLPKSILFADGTKIGS